MFSNLPYNKSDSVAALDAPVPVKPVKPLAPPPAVPLQSCGFAVDCVLRQRGLCSALHCRDAYQYLRNRGGDAHVARR